MEIVNKNRKSLFTSGRTKDFILALLTALLTVLILSASLSYAMSPFDPEKKINTLTMRHQEFDMSLFEGVERDLRDISIFREELKTGLGFDAPDFLREIFLFHMDIPFFLGLLIGADNALPVLLCAYFLKFAILGAFTYWLLRNCVKLSQLGSMVLAIALSVSMIVLTISLNTSLFNAVVILPLVFYFLLDYGWNGGRRRFVVSSIACFVLGLTGIYGVFTMLPLILISSMILSLGTLRTNFKSHLRIVFSVLLSLLMSGIILVPAVMSNRLSSNFLDALKEGTVNFNLFDSLYSLLDCNLGGSSVITRFPSIGLSVFVLTLVILFFISRVIPFRFKVCSGLFILIIYISTAYTGISRMFLFEGAYESFIYARIVFASLFVILLAAISLRNITFVSKREIYISIFSVIIYLIISNSSKSEITHGTVSMYFSAFAVILAGASISSLIYNKKAGSFLLILMVMAGITFNAAFSIAPSSFNSEVMAATYFDNASSNEGEYVFMNGEEQYIVLSQDVSELVLDSAPYRHLNIIAQMAMNDPIYVTCPHVPIYYSGVTEVGMDMYEITPLSPMETINFRVNKESSDSECYISSSYMGKCHLRVLYDDLEEDYEFDGPFLFKVELNKPSFIVAMDFEGSSFGVFEVVPLAVSDAAREEFYSKVGNIRHNEINLSSNSYMRYEGTKTVVTSLKYSPDYEVIYTKDNIITDAECFNFNGYFAFNVESGGLEHQQAKIINSKTDFILGTVTTLVGFISFIILSFMYNKKRSVEVVKEALPADDETLGENGIDKRED